MKHNPDLCRRVLVPPHIDAHPIADSPMHEGCGWTNAIRMSQAGGVRAGFDKLTCEAAAALTLWLEHDLQQVSQEILGQRVTAVRATGPTHAVTLSAPNSGNGGAASMRPPMPWISAASHSPMGEPSPCAVNGRARERRRAFSGLPTTALAATFASCSGPTTMPSTMTTSISIAASAGAAPRQSC